ncbi:MAG: hypothetical protein ETSY2_49395 [Candidatus Entotheonella gemina]|uniref:Uncharacterized protein n=1 Tax=Candidatus Entotheonella gemina TaxID=1429439 RepID=W4LBH6_9BACT|nr:MAG: hypothetical protein ETSY2_49395 [Candidatus Entotheonella gemina]
MRYQSIVVISFYLIQLVTLPVAVALADVKNDSKEKIKFVWESQSPPLIEAQKVFLESRGAEIGSIEEIDQSRGVTGVILLTLAATASVCVLADSLVQAVKDFEHSGIVVDLRKLDKITAQEKQSLKRGQVLIIKPDGEVICEESDRPDASKSLCGLLVNALNISNISKEKDKK